MLADIDHFKAVNDRYGHPAGDRVIAETAARLQDQLDADAMLARVGGEEFMVVLENTDACAAETVAQRMREEINGRPFELSNPDGRLSITISIGIVAVGPRGALETGDPTPPALIDLADRALYAAKHRGWDRVSLVTAAA